MNLTLSDEQEFLREAARGALSRHKTFEAARSALDGDGDALADLWPLACEAGWPGLLVDETHGGAGLDVFDAMLVLGECGRVLASVPLLGHLPASAILNDSPNAAELAARARKRRAARRLSAGEPAERRTASVGASDPRRRLGSTGGSRRRELWRWERGEGQRRAVVRARRARRRCARGGRHARIPARGRRDRGELRGRERAAHHAAMTRPARSDTSR